jgi:hypothetical protein
VVGRGVLGCVAPSPPTPLPLPGRGGPELGFGSITSTGTGMQKYDEGDREGRRAGRRCRSNSGGARMLAVALVDSGYGIR